MESTARPRGRDHRRRRRLQPGGLALIAGGGALGAAARVGVGHLITASPRFPWATFAVNVTGSLVLGAVAVAVLERNRASRAVWLATATGFCGAFTTLSSLAVQVDLDVRAGDTATGLVYGLASLLAGLVAVLGGTALARWLWKEKDGLGPEVRTTPGSTPWN